MIVWKDKQGKKYWPKEISDEYLLSIINGLRKGIGDKHGFITDERIDALCEEAYNRGLMTADVAHSTSLELCALWKRLQVKVDVAISGLDDPSLYQD